MIIKKKFYNFEEHLQKARGTPVKNQWSSRKVELILSRTEIHEWELDPPIDRFVTTSRYKGANCDWSGATRQKFNLETA